MMLVALMSLAGCPADRAPPSVAAPEPQAQQIRDCHILNAQTEPLVIDLQDAERAQLELALRKGPAVVRADCERGVQLLPQCEVEGDYSYVGFTQRERVTQLRNQAEVKANLPTFGLAWVSQLGVDFERGTSLDIALSMVGQRATSLGSLRPEDMRGSCEGATHFVKRAYLGAFAVEKGQTTDVRTAAQIFGVGVGAGGSSSERERVSDGDLSACKSAATTDTAPPEGCAAVLRVSLAPLSLSDDLVDATVAEDGSFVCPEGMVGVERWCRSDSELNRCRHEGDASACQGLCERGDAEGCFWGALSASDWPSLRKLCDERGHYDACSSTAGHMRDIDVISSLPYRKRACELGDGVFDCRVWADDLLLSQGERLTVAQRREALAMYERACSGGDPQGCESAAGFYIEPDPSLRAVEPDEERALSLLMESCLATPYSCSSAAQLLEGRSWCEQRGRDPKLCRTAPSAARSVPDDKERALALYRKACADSFYSCSHLFRFDAFDDARIGVSGFPIEDYCKKEDDNEYMRSKLAYYCAVAARVSESEGRGEDARLYLQRACDDSPQLTSLETAVCQDQSKIWTCYDVRTSIEASSWACERLSAGD